MGELGLSFSAKPTWVTREDGTREFVLAYTLRHVSGEQDEGEYPLGTNPSNHQAIGSAITYGRRYCLCAITGAVAEHDDDGQAASQAADAPSKRQRGKPPERAAGNLPRNADGSVSRSRTTDAELAATGQMTDAQLRDHGRLERDTKGTGPQGTQRLTETPADDPWYEDPPAVRPPRASNVAGVIHREFGRLGFGGDDKRPARLKVMSTITRRDITTTNDLTAAEALDVKRLISACRDEGVLAQKLLDLQQETPDV
jgi:hypothetical protein